MGFLILKTEFTSWRVVRFRKQKQFSGYQKLPGPKTFLKKEGILTLEREFTS